MACPFQVFCDEFRPFPQPNSYIVFSIDPVATVEIQDLNDRELTMCCHLLENKKYVALVMDFLDWISPDPSYMSYKLHLLAPGPPDDVPEKFQESSMSVPVVPSTVPHPLGRKPLAGSLPLPWSNCHHSVFAAVEVRARSALTNAPSPWNYDEDELGLYHDMLDIDRERSRAARTAAAAGLPPLPPPPQHQESNLPNCGYEPVAVDLDFPRETYYRCECPGVHLPGLSAEIYAKNFGGPCSCNECIASRAQENEIYGTGDLELGSDVDLAAALLGMMLTEGPSKMPSTVINASYDLAVLEEVNDPRQFFKELETLNQLIDMSKKRALEKARVSDEESSKECKQSFHPGRLLRSNADSGAVIPPQSQRRLGTMLAKTRRRVRQVFKGFKNRGKHAVGRIFKSLSCS
ncbi:hypothetical protein B0H11DRAFT_2018045 [Mycena galericulata]|nr:hypothetical protein B0H11DRAFT_2018045 [Mycena galericulata]